MKFRKNKFENKEIIEEVNKNVKFVNAWDVIKENFANINLTCEYIKKSLQNFSTNTNLINENLKSQANTSKKIIDNTVDNLRETKNNLQIAKIKNTSLKRTAHLENGASKKIQDLGLPLELPN